MGILEKIKDIEHEVRSEHPARRAVTVTPPTQRVQGKQLRGIVVGAGACVGAVLPPARRYSSCCSLALRSRALLLPLWMHASMDEQALPLLCKSALIDGLRASA